MSPKRQALEQWLIEVDQLFALLELHQSKPGLFHKGYASALSDIALLAKGVE